MSTSPAFSLSVSPAKATLPARVAHETITVRDGGTRPISIRTSLVQLDARAPGRCVPVPVAHWAHVTPATFVLQPGETIHATLAVNAPASVTGTHDIGVLFTGVTPGAGYRLNGAVGSQAVLNLPGHAATTSCVHVAAVQPTASAGPPWTLIGVTCVVAALAVLVTVLLRIQRRRRGVGYRQ